MDGLAERVSSLGGVPLAAPHDVAEVSTITRPPKGRESVPAQITRLRDAHEQILVQSRRAAWEANENGDDETNDLIVSDVIRTNEMHVWFLSEHLADGDPHGQQKGWRWFRDAAADSAFSRPCRIRWDAKLPEEIRLRVAMGPLWWWWYLLARNIIRAEPRPACQQ
jgi:Ferritin-like domain